MYSTANLRINFTLDYDFEIVQVQSEMHCTTCTIVIRCHVSGNGTVVPAMVLRYWHDRRVGKGTNQHGNGFALQLHFIVAAKVHYYSHPKFGFVTAHAHSTSSVASAGTVVHLGIRNFSALSPTPVRCRCASIYDSVPFPL